MAIEGSVGRNDAKDSSGMLANAKKEKNTKINFKDPAQGVTCGCTWAPQGKPTALTRLVRARRAHRQ